MLFAKLDNQPKELGKLYQRLLESLEPIDRQRAENVLYLALCDSSRTHDEQLSPFVYSWLDMLQDATIPIAETWQRSGDQLLEQCQRSEQQITALTRGLLEFRGAFGHGRDQGLVGYFEGRIHFLHRTVAEFLRDGRVLTSGSTFNLADSYFKLRLVQIAVIEDLSPGDP